MKSHPHKEVRGGCSILCWVVPGRTGAMGSTIQGFLLPPSAPRQYCEPGANGSAQVFGLWQQDPGLCSRLGGLMIVIHQEIVGNNLLTTVIMLYGSDALKCC